ncbi:hypothetical protein ACFVS2_20385 [Brevibacillus sp. NPDC058079]|uniref:hypothetical protein n=1 Tax=Brevibacillus sp. NPDC058079 TaxID=3346330 RepID=UPI0036E05586
MPYVSPTAVNNPFYSLGHMQRLTHGIMGHLIEDRQNGVVIPAFYSIKQGNGSVGRFIEYLKEKYNAIRFPLVTNPVFEGMLIRRGFKKKREYVSALKGHVDVYIWRK